MHFCFVPIFLCLLSILLPVGVAGCSDALQFGVKRRRDQNACESQGVTGTFLLNSFAIEHEHLWENCKHSVYLSTQLVLFSAKPTRFNSSDLFSSQLSLFLKMDDKLHRQLSCDILPSEWWEVQHRSVFFLLTKNSIWRPEPPLCRCFLTHSAFLFS